MTLYNLHSTADPSAFAITKFTRYGDVESHYTVSASTCDCPAGHRPSCRHRMMLPNLLPLLNTHYFWDHDRGIAVDLDGVPKSYYDNLEPKAGEDTKPALSGLQEEQILMGFHQPELCKPEPTPTKPANGWRRW